VLLALFAPTQFPTRASTTSARSLSTATRGARTCRGSLRRSSRPRSSRSLLRSPVRASCD
jgi:hypothetical protein